ncbi:hypothetical protein G6045_06955 [Streptomyces sp. YC504]|uniref:Uncharacterized protein n=1 Tax=Streptomyces mesophilus TaxID=1775132 RepID=A0A6G4XCX9_9ACTN|nr:hypothetical protein [Streptomyces mesophilus]NGO75416.1 hypothetical protein [Streptomyces mesophilus]
MRREVELSLVAFTSMSRCATSVDRGLVLLRGASPKTFRSVAQLTSTRTPASVRAMR